MDFSGQIQDGRDTTAVKAGFIGEFRLIKQSEEMSDSGIIDPQDFICCPKTHRFMKQEDDAVDACWPIPGFHSADGLIDG